MLKRKQSHTYQPRKAVPLGQGKTQHEDDMEYGRMQAVSRLTKGGQGAACLGAQFAEDGIVLLDQLVAQRRLGPVTRIARRIDEGRRAGGGRGGVHRAGPGSRQGLPRLRGASTAVKSPAAKSLISATLIE